MTYHDPVTVTAQFLTPTRCNFVVDVDPSDVGKVIGRHARNAKAIRQPLDGIAVKYGIGVNLEILEKD